MVNGGDVKELMNGGTTIIPDLDSIAEFRVLTNNVNAEFGNYSGGIVNVVTKGGGNQIHGTAFEFLRNTDLDARNFFSPDRSFYRQNQFGGTVGGPIKKDKIFYFADYQGTRNAQGLDTGLIPVPTLAGAIWKFRRRCQPVDGYRGRALPGESVVARARLHCERRTDTRPVQSSVFSRRGSFRKRCGRAGHSICCNTSLFPTTGRPRFPLAAKARLCGTTKAVSKWMPTARASGCISAYYFFDDYSSTTLSHRPGRRERSGLQWIDI